MKNFPGYVTSVGIQPTQWHAICFYLFYQCDDSIVNGAKVYGLLLLSFHIKMKFNFYENYHTSGKFETLIMS